MKLAATTGTRYRATIRLGFFESVVSNDAIAEKLLAVGLVDVQVWGSGRDRFADTTWPGAPVTVELDEHITKVEVLE